MASAVYSREKNAFTMWAAQWEPAEIEYFFQVLLTLNLTSCDWCSCSSSVQATQGQRRSSHLVIPAESTARDDSRGALDGDMLISRRTLFFFKVPTSEASALNSGHFGFFLQSKIFHAMAHVPFQKVKKQDSNIFLHVGFYAQKFCHMGILKK